MGLPCTYMNKFHWLSGLANYHKFRSFRSCVQSWTLLARDAICTPSYLWLVKCLIPLFSSKRGHVTAKHVLIRRKHEMLGKQTFEVPQPLKWMVYTIPFTYFTYSSHSRHLNHLISEVLRQRNTWFEVSEVFVYRKHQQIRKLSNFGAKVCLTGIELQMFGYQACHVCAQLEHVFLSRVHA